MSLRYYGANATLSTISTTSFSHQQVMNKNNQAKEIMKEDKKNAKNEQSNPKAEKQTASQSIEKKVNKPPVSKLSVLAIALTVCLGGFIYYHGHQQAESQQQTIAALQTEIANLKQTTKQSVVTDLQSSITDAVNKQNQQFSSLEQRIDRQLTDQQKTQQQLTNQVNDALKLNEQSLHNLNERLAAMSATENNVWLISQANYLVHLAGRKIWNDQDYTTARLLLKSADESLAQVDDPSLLPARQAINKDIASLSQVSFVDIDGIILNLMGLSDTLTELPLVGNHKEIDLGMTDYKEVQPEAKDSVGDSVNNQTTTSETTANTASESSEVSSSISDWSSNLVSNAETFMQKFITVEKLDTNESEDNFATCLSIAGKDEQQMVKCQILKTPISLEQSLYLRENIRFRLFIAAQAVPRHQELIYQRALNDVSIWVNAYFDGNSSSVKAFLDDLDNLQHQSISNQYVPEKLASSSELEKLMQTRVRSVMAK